jgi:iron complex outermembrane receptor protein
MNLTDNKSRILCSAALGALCLAFAPSAFAQEETDIDEVVVTGTSIRGVEAVGSATVKLDRVEMQKTGFNNPVDVLRTVPQIQNLGYDDVPHTAQNGNGNLQRGTTVNLRGLGSNATLLLIDGRRVAPTGNVFSFTEANQLPVSMIERIDVVADGASAIYGSDAVAGVVNYITRKSFEGIELTGRTTQTKYFSQYGASIIAGKSWNLPFGGGNAVIAYDRDHRGAMLQGKSKYLRQDQRAIGGPDYRIRGNLATIAPGGAIVVNSTTPNADLPTAGTFVYYGLPGNFQRGVTTGASLIRNQPPLMDSSDYVDFIPQTDRNQVSLNLSQDVGDRVTLYYGGYYNRRKSVSRTLQQSGLRTISAASPSYILGVPGVAAGAPISTVFSFLRDVGQTEAYVRDTSMSHTIGARVDLFADWKMDAAFTNSTTRTCANCIDPLNANLNVAALQTALNNGSFNPFGPTPASSDVLGRFLVAGADKNRSRLTQTSVRLDGPLFDLPAGTVRAAVGAEHLYLNQARTSIGIQATSDTVGAFSERKIDAFYGELFIPLISEAQNIPFVRGLDLDIAARTEKYSDVGRTSNPKVGVNWRINGDLSVKGAWGRSFRAPNLIELDPRFFSSITLATLANNAGDPTIPVQNQATRTTNVIAVSGSNPNLVPEKAESTSFTVDYQPSQVPGLRVSATYYKIHYENQIIGLQTARATYLASALNRATYAPFIVAAAQPSTCRPGERSTYNPIYQEALQNPTLVPPDESNFCSAAALVYSRNANAGTNDQDGVDLLVNYTVDTGFGELDFSASGTKILNNKVKITPTAPTQEGLDRLNYPVSLRGRLGVSWNRDFWTAGLFMNYVGSYTNDVPIAINGVIQPVSKVKSWETFDAHLAYTVPKGDGMWGGGYRISLNVQNLFDRDPPTVFSANGNIETSQRFGFDAQNANVFGRMGTLQISKSF